MTSSSPEGPFVTMDQAHGHINNLLDAIAAGAVFAPPMENVPDEPYVAVVTAETAATTKIAPVTEYPEFDRNSFVKTLAQRGMPPAPTKTLRTPPGIPPAVRLETIPVVQTEARLRLDVIEFTVAGERTNHTKRLILSVAAGAVILATIGAVIFSPSETSSEKAAPPNKPVAGSDNHSDQARQNKPVNPKELDLGSFLFPSPNTKQPETLVQTPPVVKPEIPSSINTEITDLAQKKLMDVYAGTTASNAAPEQQPAARQLLQEFDSYLSNPKATPYNPAMAEPAPNTFQSALKANFLSKSNLFANHPKTYTLAEQNTIVNLLTKLYAVSVTAAHQAVILDIYRTDIATASGTTVGGH